MGSNPNLEIFLRLTDDQQTQALAYVAPQRPGVNGHGPSAAVLPFQPMALAELLDHPFPPLAFLVDGIIAKGHLCMLGGRPKSGKSWFVLQLAQAIDQGLSFLGKETQRGRVLYIALEDGERRVNQRCKMLRWQPTEADVMFNLAHFDGDGRPGPGLQQLDELAGGYDLIIVDTLIACLSGRASENDNASMGMIINDLARIAHSHDTAVILSHHTGKGTADNIFDLLRGASALRGGYDVGLLLERKQEEREAVLHMESRDVDLSNMTIQQAANGAGWQCLGAGNEIAKIRAGRAIVETLLDAGEGLTVKELADASGKSEQTIRQQLITAERRGLTVQEAEPSKGSKPAARWWLTEAARAASVPASFSQQTRI